MSLRTTMSHVSVGTRRRLVRLRRFWWLATALLAVAAGWGVHQAAQRAAAAEAAWGTSIEVVVVLDDVEAGRPMHVEARRLPLAVLPRDALPADELPAPAGEPPTARQPLGEGEIVVRSDVEAGGVVGRIPDGWRSITVLEHRPSGAAVGERVDVVGDGLVLTRDAQVIDVDEAAGHVTIAVLATDAPAVAAADALTTLALLRHP